EEAQRVLHRHVENFEDVLSAVTDLERLAVVALPLAYVAGYVYVGEEVHLNLDDAITLTGLATAALDVEAEPPCLVSTRARFRYGRKQFTKRGEQAGVRCGV